MLGSRTRLFLVIVALLVLQTTVLVGLRVHGAHPDVMLLLAISAGIVGGPRRGALVGFAAGIAADLFLDTPFGFSALDYTIIGFVVGSLQTTLIRPSWWLTPVTATLASAVGVVLYAVIGATVGQSQMLHDNLTYIVIVVSVTNAVLAVPVTRLVAWAMPGEPATYAGTGAAVR